MSILVITDLYPVSENEKFTPRTIKNFVTEWEKMGHEVKIIKPNFLLNSFLRKKPFYKTGTYGQIENINYFLPFLGNIKNKVSTEHTGLCIAHMPSGIIFANRLGLDFVAGVHVSDLEVLTNPIYSVYFKPELERAYKNAKKIVNLQCETSRNQSEAPKKRYNIATGVAGHILRIQYTEM